MPTKVRLVKAMVFPVVMYGCASWTVKKAEHQRIDGFELWCWRRVESPLDCKEIQPVHPKADKTWVFIERTDVLAETAIHWPPDSKSWLIWKDPDAEKDWGQEEKGATGWDGWMASRTQWTWVWMASRSWWWTGRPRMLWFMGLQRVRDDWETELNWTVMCNFTFPSKTTNLAWLTFLFIIIWFQILPYKTLITWPHNFHYRFQIVNHPWKHTEGKWD